MGCFCFCGTGVSLGFQRFWSRFVNFERFSFPSVHWADSVCLRMLLCPRDWSVVNCFILLASFQNSSHKTHAPTLTSTPLTVSFYIIQAIIVSLSLPLSPSLSSLPLSSSLFLSFSLYFSSSLFPSLSLSLSLSLCISLSRGLPLSDSLSASLSSSLFLSLFLLALFLSLFFFEKGMDDYIQGKEEERKTRKKEERCLKSQSTPRNVSMLLPLGTENSVFLR